MTHDPSTLASIETRVRRLVDIEEIKQLKARYCLACDGDIVTGPAFDGEAVSGLFVDDATWESSAVATADGEIPGIALRGREAIRGFFDRARAGIPFSMHFCMAPLIDVQDDRARGHWHVLAAMTLRDGDAYWVAGHYDDDYVKTPDGWRFASTRATLGFNTPYGVGWHVTKYPQPR